MTDINTCTIPNSDLGGNHPCTTSGELCIQVTGYGHLGKPQRLFFYQDDINQPTVIEADNVKQQDQYVISPLHLDSECPSTLFNWATTKVTGHKLALQIDKQGGKINLPIVDHIERGARDHQQDQAYKHNIFLAFIPFTTHKFPETKNVYFETSAVSSARSSEAAYAPVRKGYIYIFLEGKLWRELQVEIGAPNATFANLFRDIDLTNAPKDTNGRYLETGCNYKRGQIQNDEIVQREAVGTPLEEIWVPYRINGQAQKVNILYCEEQLSGPRINYLEDNGLIGTTEIVNTGVFYLARGGREYGEVNGEDRRNRYRGMSRSLPFRLDGLPNTRPRKEQDEYRFTYPGYYLADTTGNIVSRAKQATQTIDNQCAGAATPSRNIIDGNFNYRTNSGEANPFEIDAWHQILKERYAASCTPEPFWQRASESPNTMGNTRERYIIGIAVADPMYELQHLQSLLNTAQTGGLFSYLLIKAKKTEKYSVGSFAYNMAIYSSAVRENIKNLSGTEKHLFNKSICNAERTYLINKIYEWQYKTVQLLESSITVEAIANLLSCHYPSKYRENITLMANTLLSISKAPESYDSIACSIAPIVTPGQVFVYQLASNQTGRLNQMLWPKTDDETLKNPLTTLPQPTSNDNNGSGEWYAPALIAGKEWQVDPSKLTTRKQQLTALQSDEQISEIRNLYRTEVKAGMGAVFSLVTILTDAVEASRNALGAWQQQRTVVARARMQESRAHTALQDANTDVRVANQQLATETTEFRRVELELDSAESRVRAQTYRTQMTSTKYRELTQSAGRVFRNRTYMPGIEQLRQLLHDEFGGMHYISLNQLKNSRTEYIVLGLYNEDQLRLLERFRVPNRQTAGTLVDKANNLTLATTSGNAARLGNIAEEASELFVLAVPATVKNQRIIEQYVANLETYMDVLTERTLATAAYRLQDGRVASADQRAGNAEQTRRTAAGRLRNAQHNVEQMEQLLLTARKEMEAIAYRSDMAAKFEGALRSPVLPGILLLIEAWNIWDITWQLNNIAEQRGQVRAGTGFISALADGGFAWALFMEKVQARSQAQALINYRAMLEHRFDGAVARTLGLNNIPLRAFFAGGTMALTSFLNFWDAAYYYNQDNPAWIGYMVSGVGAGLLTVQAFMAQGVVLLGAGPMGWLVAGIALVALGTYLAFALDNSDQIKLWFERGPFGDPGTKAAVQDAYRYISHIGTPYNTDFSYLQDNDKAIYRLLSLLITFHAEIKPVNKVALNAQALILGTPRINETAAERNERLQQIATLNTKTQANVQVSLVCNCAQLVEPQDIHHDLKLFTTGSIGLVTSAPEAVANYHQRVLHSETTANRVDYYIQDSINRNYTNLGIGGVMTNRYLWIIKAQLKAKPLAVAEGGTTTYYFPAPKLEHNLTYTTSRDRTANFERDYLDYQPFWYSTKLSAEVSNGN